jgi:hypothetical protein
MRTLSNIICLVCCLAQAAAAGHAIEFSPTLQEYSSDGIVCHRLAFRDDQRTVYYQPPRNWHCTVDGSRLRLVPPDKTFAEAEITSRPLEKPAPLDEAATKGVTQQALATLPPGSQQPLVEKQEQNALMLNNNPAFEALISYKILGDTFQRSILVVNTPLTQITFRFTARKSDFDALYRAFRASVVSWEWQPEDAHEQAAGPGGA